MPGDIEIIAAPRGPERTKRVGLGMTTLARDTQSTVTQRKLTVSDSIYLFVIIYLKWCLTPIDFSSSFFGVD